MKILTKKNAAVAGLGALCVLSLSLGAGMLTNGSPVYAESNAVAPDASAYFYDGLTDANGNEYTLAKKFYNAFDELNKAGDFKDGVVEYELSSILTSEQIKGWVVDGDLTVPKAFSAARDAFITDHPELFYVNLYKATISAGRNNGVYTAYIDSGREANLYYDNGFKTQAEVETAISALDAKINEVVDYVIQKEQDNTYVARDVYLAKEVNIYLAEHIKYDYAAYEGKDDPNYVAAAYINTPYGGLVEGKAVCGGFSTAYKVVMDRLEIPCITVNGYSNNRDEYGFNSGSSVYHMWNYVWLETPSESVRSKARAASGGAWYSVDVTWNSASYSRTRYAVLNADIDAEYHVTDGQISSSGYKLRYPELSKFAYGSTGETDGLQFSLTYESTGLKDDFDHDLVSTYVMVSYNGKSAKRLYEEDGLYLAIRDSYYMEVDGEMKVVWTDWFSLEVWRQFAIDHDGVGDVEQIFQDNGIQTRYYENTSVYGIQAAVFDVKPDRAASNSFPGDPNLGHDPETESYFFYYYGNTLLEKSNAVAVSEVLSNQSYGTYAPAPYVDFTANPNATASIIISDAMRDNKNNSLMDPAKAFTLTVTYDQPLHVLNEDEPIGISFTSIHPNAQKYAYFVPYEDGQNVRVIDEYTLEFKFCPSLMYEHNDDGYNFFFTNIGSAKKVMRKTEDGSLVETTLDKLPNSAHFLFGRALMACPARFNYDGRLWVETCAQPTLVSNSDLSENNFKDADGNTLFSEAERSQMMLVAERADTDTVDAMLDGIGDIEGSNITKSDIRSSTTYDIKLQMCNKYPTIPDGSYVKIALGFPEGFGPKDEGVTFKIFHRKHIQGDEYIIEEIPCVVTQFGIVACVTSFSPYMVAVVDADKATTKNVYASIEGKGGKLTQEDGKIKTLNEGDSCTYTIKPDDGYIIYSVTLNHKEIKDRVSADGKLTLSYNELDGNNELEIKYIAIEAAHRYLEKSIEEPVKTIVNTDGVASAIEGTGGIKELVIPTADSSQLIGLIIGIVVIAVVFCAAVTAVVITVRKRQR